jgi:hypothetical protein
MANYSNDATDTVSYNDYGGGNDPRPSMRALSPLSPPLISEEMVMDYFTLRGIENKLGVKKEDIPKYILQELLDNASDYIETNPDNIPELNVHITTNDKAIHLKVSNQNAKKQIFTDQKIEDMFNYYNYSSTKRNQFKIGRGALGHGLKTVLSASHTFAKEHYGHSNWKPLIIRNGNTLWTISLSVDRITGYQPPVIKSEIVNDIEKTEIQIDIPIDSETIDKSVFLLKQSLRKYLLLNPHITVNITINDKTFYCPQVQRIKSDWRNLHSIHSYTVKDFEYFISTIQGKGTLYDAIISFGIKEAYSLTKRTEYNIPLTHAQYDKAIIYTLYYDLKKKPSTDKLDLPYDMRLNVRKAAIMKRLQQLEIKVSSIKFNSINRVYESKEKGIKFPFVCECAEIRTEEDFSLVTGINSSPADLIHIQNPAGFKYFKKSDSSTYHTASSISELLQTQCGYDPSSREFKKNNIIFINLVSPRIDYASYAKSQINLEPFSDHNSVGQLVYDTFFRIKGNKTQAEIRLEFLTDRYNAVKQVPRLIIDDRWTPSDVWYGCRPILLENGIIIGSNTRSNFTAAIRDVCEKEFNCNMEELGIFAADRAQIYFDGHWYDVGFDDLHSLKRKGTELIIFEKEGMAETLTVVADRYGWAVLFTRGFATKYVRDLSELCKKYRGNACVLSDYDDSGILLASKLNVPRIGIDPETLEYFKLDREDVEEEYDPKNHLAGIKNLVSEEEFDYLSHYRIEINSVKTKVGSKAFQDWIIHKIQVLFPRRDYNRAIKLGDAVLPDGLKEQIDKITAKIQRWQKPKCDQKSKQLSDIEGFKDVPKLRIDLENELKKVITDIPDFQNFIQKLNELTDSFPDGDSS